MGNVGGKSRTWYKHKTGPILGSVLLKLGRKMGKEMLPQYQPAIITIESDVWRIQWYNLHPTKNILVRVRKTFALNRIKDLTERNRVALEYVKIMNEGLSKGWNVFNDAAAIPVTEAKPATTITDALAQALKIRLVGMKPRTADSYRNYNNKLQQWIEDNHYQALPADQFSADMFQQYIISKSEVGHGNRNINDHINYFKTTFEVMRKKIKCIAINPIEGFDYLPQPESKKFQPITADEIERIVPALIAHNAGLYLYCKFIADEYIRPYHITRLKARDINYSSNEITLGGDTVKTGRNASKQLMAGLKKMLIEMGYHKLPGNYYLFTKNFVPGKTLYSTLSTRASEAWKKVVIDGLGIDKHMYALKHTSAQYFVNNNAQIDVYYLRQQLEHSSAMETEIYLQKNVKKKVKDSDVKTLKF